MWFYLLLRRVSHTCTQSAVGCSASFSSCCRCSTANTAKTRPGAASLAKAATQPSGSSSPSLSVVRWSSALRSWRGFTTAFGDTTAASTTTSTLNSPARSCCRPKNDPWWRPCSCIPWAWSWPGLPTSSRPCCSTSTVSEQRWPATRSIWRRSWEQPTR